MKEKDKISKKDLNETEISEFKIAVIMMLTKVSKTMHEQSQSFNK